jgi:predicted lipoprotein with Yx(FWY)xxD motif
MRKATRAGAALGAAAAVLLAGACGSQQSDGATTVQPAGAAADAYGTTGAYGGSVAGTAPPARAAAASAGGISTSTDAKLGEILVDGQGRTLYRYDKDTADPPASNCNDACAQAWPPVPAAAASGAKGADPALLGEVTRADGTKQLTVAGWPMYLYAADSAAGQTNGQGVNQVWWAVLPDGKKAGRSAAPVTAVPSVSAPPTSAPSESAPSESDGAASAPLAAVDDPNLGQVLVNSKGFNLYRFTKDVAWPMKISCLGPCVKVWPPAPALSLADQEKAARALGISKKLLTNIKRPDGTWQLAINCWPVYSYSKDTTPGRASGQGVGGTWFAVTPAGKLAK